MDRMKQAEEGPDEADVDKKLKQILQRTQHRMESVRGGRKGKRGRPKPESERPPAE